MVEAVVAVAAEVVDGVSKRAIAWRLLADIRTSFGGDGFWAEWDARCCSEGRAEDFVPEENVDYINALAEFLESFAVSEDT